MEGTPEERARAAAEELAARQEAVTARAVRAASGVRMAVAADVARAWNEERAGEVGIPAVPSTMTTRFEGMWREAFTLARESFDVERAGWAARLDEARADLDVLGADVEDLEGQRDAALEAARGASEVLDAARGGIARAEAQAEALRVEVERVRDEVRAAQGEAAEARTRADRAEGRAESAQAEVERVRDELRAAQAEAAEARTRADRAEASLAARSEGKPRR